jgi:hypothetical protein
MIPRRSFLTGLGASLVAAPAIVRAGSLMPVKSVIRLTEGRIQKLDGWARYYRDYANLPPQWQDRFAPHHPHHLRLS